MDKDTTNRGDTIVSLAEFVTRLDVEREEANEFDVYASGWVWDLLERERKILEKVLLPTEDASKNVLRENLREKLQSFIG